MRNKKKWMQSGLGLALLGTCIIIHAADFNQTFNDAKSWGAQQQAGIPSGINAGTAQSKVPNYQPTNPATNNYGNGNTPLFGLGASKVSDCSNNPSDPRYTGQECNAVNTIAKSPSQRPQFSLNKNDPIFQQGSKVLADPSQLAGSVNGTYSGCTTQTTTIPATYENQVCHDYIPTTDSSCSVGRNVTIDPNYIYQCLVTNNKVFSNNTCQIYDVVTVQPTYNYQCTTTPQTVVQQSCKKVLSVQVTQTTVGCASGTAFGSTYGSYGNTYSATGYCNGNPGQVQTSVTFCHGGGTGCCSTSGTITANNAYVSLACQTSSDPRSGLAAQYKATCDSNYNCTFYQLDRSGTYTFNYQGKVTSYTTTDTWDDQCTTLESQS